MTVKQTKTRRLATTTERNIGIDAAACVQDGAEHACEVADGEMAAAGGVGVHALYGTEDGGEHPGEDDDATEKSPVIDPRKKMK